jgi:hypothetical protein
MRLPIIRFVTALAAVLTPALVLAEPCRNVTFDSAPTFYGAPRISALMSGDMDGDGDIDLVVASVGDTFVVGHTLGLSVLLNDGSGHFPDRIIISDTIDVAAAQIADFDGDGRLDIVIDESTTDRLKVFANRGDRFVETVSLDAPGAGVLAGDFNGDRRADVVRRSGADLIVMLGGNGSFSTMAFHEPQGVHVVMTVADIDSDGRDDLIEAFLDTRVLTIRHGDPASGLGEPKETVTLHQKPYQLLVGDFDGSGKLDILAIASTTTTLELLRDPATLSGEPIQIGGQVTASYAAGDFTGDRVADVLSSEAFSTGVSVAVLGADFRLKRKHPSTFGIASSRASLVAAADFDGNGSLDVAVSNDKSIAILLNRGDGTFVAPPNIGVRGVRVVADIDHDGIADLITDGTTIVWFGTADGTYRAGKATRPGDRFYSNYVEIADINHDGNQDVVVVANSTGGTFTGYLWVLLGDGSGGFDTRDLGPFGYRPTAVFVTDLDVDGNLDVVAGNRSIGISNAAPVTIAYGRGDGTFEAPVDLAGAGSGEKMRIGDFTGDGLPDLIAVDSFGRTLIVNLSGRSYKSTRTTEPVKDEIELADLNGDGKADLIEIARLGTPSHEILVDVISRLSRGDGTFAPGNETVVKIIEEDDIAIADMNNDGVSDIVIADWSSSDGTKSFALLRGRGNGTFDSPQYWSAWGTIRLIDFNRDGRMDVMHDGVVRLNSCLDTPPRHRSVTH